jgi:16S rRNA G966 N2-methylase RsmD
MDINTILKIFPENEKPELLKYDDEGLWSITYPDDAEQISSIIKSEIGENITIIDGTCGLGGNLLSFAKNFKNVIGIEISKERFQLLVNNISQYNYNNINLINDNIVNHLEKIADAFFIDPPWGGPEYLEHRNIRIKLGEYKLINIINKIKNKKDKIIFLKLPKNYDLSEFNKLNYKINKIKNYLLLTIY